MIPSFHCSDPCDKLYGILSLVDWSSSVVAEADYSKNVLSLAVEVFNLMRKPSLSFVSWTLMDAQVIAEAFALSYQDDHVQHAMQIRFNAVHGSHHPVMDLARLGFLLNSADVKGEWPGQLSLSEGASHETQLFLRGGARNETKSSIVDSKGTVCVSAPLGAEAGDWYIPLLLGLSDGKKTGLIIRATDGPNYALVGVASDIQGTRASIHMDDRFSNRYWRISWSTYDALLLSMMIKGCDDISTLVNYRICASPGSSFAREWDY